MKRISALLVKKLALLVGIVALSWALTSCGSAAPDLPNAPFSQGDTAYSGDNLRTVRPYGSQILFDHISLEDGLSQSSINDMLQDGRGLLWLATANGLNRFDGYNIEVFKHDPSDANSLPGNQINVLFEDLQSRLWVGTEEGGLAIYDRKNEQFDPVFDSSELPDSHSTLSVKAILQAKNGDIWVGTSTGLIRIAKDGSLIDSYDDELNPTGEESDSLAVADLHQDENGLLWIATLGGLVSFDPADNSFHYHVISQTDPASNRISTLFEDLDGHLWIGTLGGGLHLLDTSSDEIMSFRYDSNDDSSLSSNIVTDIIQDHFGSIWISTQNGLDRLVPDRSRFVHYQHDPDLPGTLPDNEILSLFVDQAGVFWIGTARGGAAKYDPYKAKFTHIYADRNDPRMLSHPEVNSLFVDSQDFLWIGTSSGLDRLDLNTRRITRFEEDPFESGTLPNNEIRGIVEDNEGRIWIATPDHISLYQPILDRFETYPSYPEDPRGIVSNGISSVALDQDGTIWIGTFSSGLSRLDPDRESSNNFRLSSPVGNSNMPILTILPDSIRDLLWLGTQVGLVRFDPETQEIVTYRHLEEDPTSLGYDQVNVISFDGEEGLWLGTNAGLDHFDPVLEQFTHFGEKDGLPSNVVLGIEIDNHGLLWISTDRGLSRFDPSNHTFRNFDADDGLQSLEFNRGAHFRDNSGTMYFGGINGVNLFQPESISDNLYLAPLIISGFQVFNRPVRPGSDSLLESSIIETEEISLDRSDSVFSFELASLHFGSPEENQYAYIMEGFDEDWNLVGNRRFATYTNLPPGKYTFHAAATNNDGIWNPLEKTIDIFVPYPFWQQWWFIGLVLALIIGSVVLGYRLRTRSSVRRTKELEELVVERTSEIEQRRQIAEGLREILVILNTTPSLEESLHYIVAQAARLTDAEDAIIFRSEEHKAITVVATNPGGQIKYTLEPTLLKVVSRWADNKLLEKEPLIISDLPLHLEQRDEEESLLDLKHCALLGIPLAMGDEIYGGLLMFYNQVREFGHDDLELGFTFVDQAALAIANNRLREQVKLTAAASERNRLARELHDAVTQTLFSASLIAETLAPAWESDPSEGQQLLSDLRQLTRGALAEMRTLLMELRPASLEEANLSDLLLQLGEAFMGRTGIPIDIQASYSCELPVNVRIALYRIAQESLNNVVKHARADYVEVTLSDCTGNDGVTMSIIDDGRGFDPNNVPGHHLGLNIIRERANAIEAKLEIISEIGQGTKVQVQWTVDDTRMPL